MVCAAIAALTLAPKELRILFLGNSHTSTHDVPGMVERLLESDGSGRVVTVQTISGGLLKSHAQDTRANREIRFGRWNVVVLQGAEISSSNKYTYSQQGGISLAKLAKAAKARPLLFAEHPRRGWDESDYIYNVYKGISKASGAPIAPVCFAWDAALARSKALALWSADGNHTSPLGAYLAAHTLYYCLAGSAPGKPSWRPPDVDAPMAELVRSSAKAALARKAKSGSE